MPLRLGTKTMPVGACRPTWRELDGAAVARAQLFVDRRESAMNESGDILLARQEGAIGDDHIQGELGDLLLSHRRGRRTAEEVTLFK